MKFLFLATFFLAQDHVFPPQPAFPTYSQAWQAKGVLVTFLGGTPRQVRGSMTMCRADVLPGYVGPAVIVSRNGEWIVTLPATATDSDIRRAAGLEVSRSAAPFELPASSAQLDDSVLDRVPILREMEPYKRYTVAQHPLSRTYRFAGAPFFNFVPRASLERKWTIPGGLDGIRATSIVLRGKDNRVRNWVDHIDPNDNISEIVHQRSYSHATFAEVLLNESGKAFEVRLAAKRDGKWQRFVAFADADAAPAGYMRVRNCGECHDKAGTGAYDTAYVPGGDTVISEPLEGIER